MLEIRKYTEDYKDQWDNFVKNSKNGVFLFLRDYMEYHADRFQDSSLLFLNEGKLIGLMPANIEDDTVVSHAGLTFGGIISNITMKTPIMLEIFKELKNYLKEEGIHKFIYRAAPHIYHSFPAEEDLYALFVNGGELIRRDVSSAVFMRNKPAFSNDRKRNVKKARKKGLEVTQSFDYDTFMDIEEIQLEAKYGLKPTHTKKEMKILANRFPENIKLFTANKNGKMVSGVIVYESMNVAHTQYIASTDEGKKLYATVLVLDFLINDHYKNKRWFDFGISTEDNGFYLNDGLISFKERFGTRAIVHDFYEIKI